jgi:hypothetical protein
VSIDLSKFVYELKTMDWNTWKNAFLPQPNSFNSAAKIDGKFFEHEGQQWEFISSQHAQQLWTMVEEEDGTLVLRNGVYVKRRRGYFFCERWHNPRELFRIPVPQELLKEF